MISALGLSKDKPTITYCRTGVSATAVYLCLKEAGFTDVKLYDGSWSEFGTDESTIPFSA